MNLFKKKEEPKKFLNLPGKNTPIPKAPEPPANLQAASSTHVGPKYSLEDIAGALEAHHTQITQAQLDLVDIFKELFAKHELTSSKFAMIDLKIDKLIEIQNGKLEKTKKRG